MNISVIQDKPVLLTIITFCSIFLASSVLILVFLALLRRSFRRRYFRKLDRMRREFRILISRVLEGKEPINFASFQKPHRSLEWSAVEELLVNKRRTYPDLTQRELYLISTKLGYTSYYLNQLKNGSALKRAFAAEQLGRMGAVEAVPILLKGLYDKNFDVRIGSCRALALIDSPECTEALLGKLTEVADHSNDLSLRILIPAISKRGTDIEAPIIARFDQSSAGVRSIFAQLLVDNAHSGLIPFFIRAALDPEAEVRAKALRGLSKIPSEESVSTIIGLVSDSSWFVRLQVVKAIGALRHPRFYSVIWKGLTDSNWQVRVEAGKSLVKIGSESFHLISDRLLWPEDRFAKEQIFEELQRSGFISSRIDQLGSKTGEERNEALSFLETALEFGVINLFIDSALHHTNPGVRLNMLRLLSKKNNSRVKQMLNNMVRHESNFEVCEEAKRQLKKANAL